MNQKTLFQVPHNGTDTSIAAAESMKPHVGRIQSDVLEMIKRMPMTCDRVEQVLGLSHQTASARIRELRGLNLIKDSGRKAPTRSGRKAVVWEVV